MKIRNIFRGRKNNKNDADLGVFETKCEAKLTELWACSNCDTTVIKNFDGTIKKGNSSFETFLITFYPALYTLFYNAFLKYQNEVKGVFGNE